MFGDTITLTFDATPVVLNKINQDDYKSEYLFRDSTHQYRLFIRHTTTLKSGVTYDRHNVEVTETVFASGEVAEYTRKAYFVLEQLPSDTDVFVFDAMADWSIATSNVNLDKLLGWQS